MKSSVQQRKHISAIALFLYRKFSADRKMKIVGVIILAFLLLAIIALAFADIKSNEILRGFASFVFRGIISIITFFIPFSLAHNIVKYEISHGYYKTVFVKPITPLFYYLSKFAIILLYSFLLSLVFILVNFLVLNVGNIITITFLAAVLKMFLFNLLVIGGSFLFSAWGLNNTILILIYYFASSAFDLTNLNIGTLDNNVLKIILKIINILLLPIKQLSIINDTTTLSDLAINSLQILAYGIVFIAAGAFIITRIEMGLKEE